MKNKNKNKSHMGNNNSHFYNNSGSKSSFAKPEKIEKAKEEEEIGMASEETAAVLEAPVIEIDIKSQRKAIDTEAMRISVKEKKLLELEHRLSIQELEAKNGFPKLLEKQFKELEKGFVRREEELTNRLKELEKKSEELRRREDSIREAEISREEGYTGLRKALSEELEEKRSKFEEEIAQIRLKRMKELETFLERERVQRIDSLQEEISKSRSTANKEILLQIGEIDHLKNKELKEIEVLKKHLSEGKLKLHEELDELEFKTMLLNSKDKDLNRRKQGLDSEVDERVNYRIKSFESKEASLLSECERLRESVNRADEEIGLYKELERKLGGEAPEKVLFRLNAQEEELKRLRKELIDRPTNELRQIYDEMEKKNAVLEDSNERFKSEMEVLQSKFNDFNQMLLKFKEMEDENKSLLRRYESVQADNNRLTADLRRLQSSYEREADRESRIKEIESPLIQNPVEIRKAAPTNEIEWLNEIEKSCLNYGFKFPRRILYAFHTGIKTSEWSPLTVLAGVSGTGKSELPRLYCHFGGINYLPLAVQPNWDSQESMLGFFNSIDNKFDAQPVLRFLAQSQKGRTEEYPGQKDVMNLVLLDEMNLAHIELYFAEFLSKLELRRGKKAMDVPQLDVKIGAGCEPYPLKLGRNVLWAGTMNQDETTKSLSDKVLDRGIVINFPRPTTFERRTVLKHLGEEAPRLTKLTWHEWWSKESCFTEEQIRPYKEFVEEINRSLSVAGRALGHRVWQSIEYYMANYPTVRLLIDKNSPDYNEEELKKAMKIAFEDQLVQKVMPKLRGIETRGKSRTECLDKIKAQLVDGNYSIVEDFEIACEFGYGQFMWQSANYLKEDIIEDIIEDINFETIDDDSKR